MKFDAVRATVVRAFAVLVLMLVSQAAVAANVSVGFEDGFVGEFERNAHQPQSIKTFATLGIDSVVISQNSTNADFGGTSGTDYAVTLTIQFFNGATKSFPATISWRDGSTDGIGLTVGANVDDGISYSLRTGFQKTYLLRLVGSNKVYSDTAVGVSSGVVSGNSSTGNALGALNVYLDAQPKSTTPSSLTSQITSSPTSILASGMSTSAILVQLKDVNGNNLEAGGAAVTLSTTAGTLSAIVDNQNGTYSATLTSSTSLVTATITGTVDGFNITDDAAVSFTSSSSISGTLRNSSGNGVSGRTVSLVDSNAQIVATTTTGATGAYTFANVAPGTYSIVFENSGGFKAKGKSASGTANGNKVESITVAANTTVASVDAVVIDPAGVVYDSTTRQPVAGAIVRFLYDNSLVDNSLLDQNLGGPNPQTTDADGNYSFVLNSSALDGTYTLEVIPPPGYGFQSTAITPTAGSYTPDLGGGLESIQPQSTAPTGSDSTIYYLSFNFTIGTDSLSTSNGVINNHIPIDPIVVSVQNTKNSAEPSTNGTFTVSLSAASTTDTVIAYSVGGTATAGTDYNALYSSPATAGSVTIATGQTSATISVIPIDDSDIEGPETVIVNLTSVTSGSATLSTTASQLTATNTIADNDTAGFALSKATASVSEPATTDSFTVVLTKAPASDVVVTIGSSDTGEATVSPATLTFTSSNWNTPQTVTVTGVDDALVDGDQSSTVTVAVDTASSDASYGSVASQTVAVTTSDNDTSVNNAPAFTGANVGDGASYSFDYYENAAASVTLASVAANDPDGTAVTFSITAGNDDDWFAIDLTTGAIRLTTAGATSPANDFESMPNVHLLTVSGSDGALATTIEVRLVEMNRDDITLTITGPSGGPGAPASAITVNEGTVAVTTFTADEEVTWSTDGGADESRVQMNAQTGAITFVSAPDFENPTDSDRNNSYIVRVKATDAAGNISIQTLTVTIANVDEIDRRLAQAAVALRDGLRGYAAQGLSDMLSFNESLMLGAEHYNCTIGVGRKPLSGAFNANERGGNAGLNYGQRLTDCGKRYQLFVDTGATYSKAGGDWNARLFASARVEAKVNADLFVGLNVLASRSNDQIAGFGNSTISDDSSQLGIYARYRMSETVRAGVFASVGSSQYDFALNEADGFALKGKMQGDRQVFGAMLSGDIDVGGITLTTDAVLSHAAEQLGTARLSAKYLGEDRSDIAFGVGAVDVTRLSVPLSAPITLTGAEDGIGAWSQLQLAGGLLCEDNVVAVSAMTCGYQMRVKILAAQDGNNRFYADVNWESVAKMRRSVFAMGYARRFGPDRNLELGLELNQRRSSAGANDNAIMLELKVAQ